MAGLQFHETVMGNRFFTAHVPQLINAVNRLADAIEASNKLAESKEDYTLVFKYYRGKPLYISRIDENGNILTHTEYESEAHKFFDLEKAMAYTESGYGLHTKVVAKE